VNAVPTALFDELLVSLIRASVSIARFTHYEDYIRLHNPFQGVCEGESGDARAAMRVMMQMKCYAASTGPLYAL
jgi:hypothetical protein